VQVMQSRPAWYRFWQCYMCLNSGVLPELRVIAQHYSGAAVVYARSAASRSCKWTSPTAVHLQPALCHHQASILWMPSSHSLVATVQQHSRLLSILNAYSRKSLLARHT
jgi:hypothetical protein